jgi:hypothetical protein
MLLINIIGFIIWQFHFCSQMVQFFDWKFIKEEDLQILELADNDIEVKK